MTHRIPDYCPYCGTELVSKRFDGRERQFCEPCQEFIFQNPRPIARVVVLDGDLSLFVKRGIPPDCGRWTIPGGFIEIDESAAVAAVRELEEETDLRVSPEDIDLIRTGFHLENPDDGSILSICFAVERIDTTGTPQVGDEPAAVRFWNPNELLDSDEKTRSVDLRCLEAAYRRSRGEVREFVQ